MPEYVFKDAKVNTLISIIEKNEASKTYVEIFDTLEFLKPPLETKYIDKSKIKKDRYVIHIHEHEGDSELITSLEKNTVLLGSIAKPCSGYNPYEVGKGEKPGGGKHTKETVNEKPYHSKYRIDESWKLEIGGSCLK